MEPLHWCWVWNEYCQDLGVNLSLIVWSSREGGRGQELAYNLFAIIWDQEWKYNYWSEFIGESNMARILRYSAGFIKNGVSCAISWVNIHIWIFPGGAAHKYCQDTRPLPWNIENLIGKRHWVTPIVGPFLCICIWTFGFSHPFLDTGLYLLCTGGQDLEHNITFIAACKICNQIWMVSLTFWFVFVIVLLGIDVSFLNICFDLYFFVFVFACIYICIRVTCWDK